MPVKHSEFVSRLGTSLESVEEVEYFCQRVHIGKIFSLISARNCLQHLFSVENSSYFPRVTKQKCNTLLKQKFQSVGLREADGNHVHQMLQSPHRFLLC